MSEDDKINSEAPGLKRRKESDDSNASSSTSTKKQRINIQSNSTEVLTVCNTTINPSESKASSSTANNKQCFNLELNSTEVLRVSNPAAHGCFTDGKTTMNPSVTPDSVWNTAFLDQRRLLPSCDQPIAVDTTTDSTSSTLLSTEQLEPINWTITNFNQLWRKFESARNQEIAELKKEVDLAQLGRTQADDARKLAIDQLSAAEIEFQDKLEAVQKQRDEARSEANKIKRDKELLKGRVESWKNKARLDCNKRKEAEELQKRYQDWNIESNLKIDELEGCLDDLKYNFELVETERDLALKENLHPSWKLQAQLKVADDKIRYQTQVLARHEARKGKYQKLTPPISKLVTPQEELISDLTSALILLSKWCDLKKLSKGGRQTKRLKILLSHPDRFPCKLALQTMSLLVRQISFVHLHLVEGHMQGPGEIQPRLLFDIAGLSSLVSQHRNLSVEPQIDYNCCDPRGFASVTPPDPPEEEDYRRGLQDYLHTEAIRKYKLELETATQSSASTRTRTSSRQDDLFEATQVESTSQDNTQLATYHESTSSSSQSPSFSSQTHSNTDKDSSDPSHKPSSSS